MKISINASVFNAFASRLVGTSALYRSLAVQKGLSNTQEDDGFAERALGKVPFFANIKEEASKAINITKTENEVVVDINDQYIIGSINLAFNLYDRIADAATTMFKEAHAWDKEVKAFEAEWSETTQFDSSAAWSKVCEEVAKAPKVDGKVSDIIKQPADSDNHFGTTEVVANGIKLVAGEGRCKAIYAPDIDKQVVVNALNAYREGEKLPYKMSTAIVTCICQSKLDPYHYVGNAFDLPISVINAVRDLYELPRLPTKEEVAANDKARDEKREADRKAEQEAKKAKQTK